MARRAALIIGGVGGIGEALVKGLQSRFPSWHVLATSSNGRQGSVSMNVTNDFSVSNARVEVQDSCARNNANLSVVINTAGILHDRSQSFGPERTYKTINSEFLMKNLAVNTIGWANIAREFGPLLEASAKQEGEGEGEKFPSQPVLCTLSARVGSIADNSLGGWYSYRAAKAAQNQLTKTLALELKRKRVLCFALHPGTVATDLSQPFQRGVPKDKLFTTEQSAAYLLDVISGTTFPHDCGKFYDWKGEEIPW